MTTRSLAALFSVLTLLAIDSPLALGQDPAPPPPETSDEELEIQLSLERAVRIALARNLDIRIEHLGGEPPRRTPVNEPCRGEWQDVAVSQRRECYEAVVHGRAEVCFIGHCADPQ